ncbi:adenylosuccinate lyase [Algibacter marinivivus]|uniref:Adenylosuccinate lyase n=1 Tax=Algibacter marinivivus TaxID=2100723 RepID=A0A2U2X5S6_9FLAO|nr:adenylosuccinate lyase [Algibacter marinivivus]PWH83139.1 adenylosuccinate lyase [Algibacter marinivivus]
MSLSALNAISPIDGRYRNKVNELAPYFSEEALIKYRVLVEIEYFIALCEIPLPQLKSIDSGVFDSLRAIYKDFSAEDATAIKKIESVTNHDVKAVEYFIKEQFDTLGLSEYKEFIHFGLTSQDINNTAIPLSIKDAMNDVYVPEYFIVLDKLKALSKDWATISMLARTHGQPASPTRLGKEIEVFVVRLEEQFNLLNDIPSAAKFGGATGNFNAHFVAYPDIDWKAFGSQFVQEKLGLQHSFPTTQIEHYDHMAALFDTLKRINTIILDLDRDIWTYVSMDYFKQKIKAGEVGSSAMPHKVNPIDFENSEGNLGIANAIFEHLSAKLPVSRLQRDLTDSTVLRNVGVPFGHTLIGFKSTLKGLNKLLLNESKFAEDLENNWAVVAEAIQTILRREGYPNPYEALKGLTRTNAKINQDSISNFIDTLDVSNTIKEELKRITPSNYTGI